MKFGVNLLLLNGSIGPRELRCFGSIADMGFDGVEIPVFEPRTVPVARILRQARSCGLSLSVSGALPPGARLYGLKAAPVKKALSYLQQTIRVAADLGSSVICGPLYKAVGDIDDSMPLAAQRRSIARNLAPALALAREQGIVLAFEPLNRFETNLLNTTAQGIDFCGSCRDAAAGLLLDTFHMHIEEKSSAQAFRAAARAGVLSHVHAAENDRGTAGSGQVRWDEAAAALAAARYDGWVILESFSQKVAHIRKAVSCWRPFYESPEAFMKQGLAFVKKTFAA